MSRYRRRLAVCCVALLAVGILSLALLNARADSDVLVVGCKNFTESRLLAALMARTIRDSTGLPVEVRELGSTTLCFDALRTRAIHIYPEYTGTLLVEILRGPSVTDPGRALDEARRRASQQFQMEVLEPFGFNNTYVLAMRGDRARQLEVQTLSDLTRHPELQAGFTSEFLQRSDGYPGLAAHYGLRFRRSPVDLAPGHMYGAVRGGQVDLISAFSTDFRLDLFGLTALEDDRGFFPAYQAVPLVRRATLERYPALKPALARLKGRIDDQAMRELNRQADQHRDPVNLVAARFLQRLTP
ncbi:MAG: glycine betaine ABC transporter substrate-binding protein [Candidatus Eremiobacterota bacterium]